MVSGSVRPFQHSLRSLPTDRPHYTSNNRLHLTVLSMQCGSITFSALMLLVGWQQEHLACKKLEWWGAGMVICLELGADCICPSWCHCHSLSLALLKSRLVLPFWYRLTRVVPEKGPLNECVCVCATWLNEKRRLGANIMHCAFNNWKQF